MQRTKILVFLAVWKRPHITELCFVGLERLKTHPDFEIEVLAVISEDSMKPLCEKYGVHWVMAENLPLGKKKNTGLAHAQKFEFDYLMEIGSDDLILNELLDAYKPFLSHGVDFFGVRDAAYIHSSAGHCRRLISKSTYGAGRMISRKALIKAKWKLWKDSINRGLDNNSVFALGALGFKYQRLEPGEFPMVIDVKSDENLWHFDYFLGVEYEKNLIYERLSKQEVELLESYVTVETADRAA